MSEIRAAAPTGWIIGVMLETERGAAPVRHYYAVGRPDRNRAEWAAVDSALPLGAVAPSPYGGHEPVEAVAPLSPGIMKAMGLADGQVRALGPRWPRRWLAR
jgi:hypothetical protein